MTPSHLISLLKNPSLLDYKTLSSKESLEVYEETLNGLLKDAEQRFAEILKTPESEISFASIGEKYLNQDEELGMLWSFLHHLNGTNATQKTREIIESFQPKMVEYGNKISLNPEYFSLLQKVSSSEENLDNEQKRSLELLFRGMKVAGVHLQGEKKKRLEEINHKLSELTEKFSNNVLDSRKEFSYHFTDDESFGEMPESDRHTAEEEAKNRGKDGWIFTLSAPSYQAIMEHCIGSSVRQHFWEANVQVASSGKHDNRPLVLEILALRKEKANLLGFDTYADYVLQERMAENPQQVFSMLSAFAEKAKEKAKREWKKLEAFSGLKNLNHWDIAFYSEKLKKHEFNIESNELRKYFPLHQVISGLFQTAETLFGLTFQKIKIPLYDESVLAYEVFSGKKRISYFLFDLFARPEKRGGAWCNDLRHSRKKITPIVVNVSNFAKGTISEPPLLTHYDVQTMFHEFGHGLHVMLSKNTYTNTSGFHTEWDFVELPSQLFENWTWEKEALTYFAKHFETHEVISEKMMKSLHESRKFLKGMFLLRQNEFGFLDFFLHTEEPPKTIEELDTKVLSIANAYSVLEKPEYYKMYASFSHIFDGGYAAGYYSYLWAEILEADVFTRFQKEGILSPVIGRQYAEKILSQGAKKDGAQIFRDFMGREPSPDALLEKFGLTYR